jgi:hypothetical protein
MCLWAFYQDHKSTLCKCKLPVVEGAFSLACLGVFAFSANTMTGKSAWSHPALPAWMGEKCKKAKLICTNQKMKCVRTGGMH